MIGRHGGFFGINFRKACKSKNHRERSRLAHVQRAMKARYNGIQSNEKKGE